MRRNFGRVSLGQLHEAAARDQGARDPQGRPASLRAAQEVGEVLEEPKEDDLLSQGRVQADVHAARILEHGVALAPDRVPGLLLAVEPRSCYTRVDLVDLG